LKVGTLLGRTYTIASYDWIPAFAGMTGKDWIPASAGMTDKKMRHLNN